MVMPNNDTFEMVVHSVVKNSVADLDLKFGTDKKVFQAFVRDFLSLEVDGFRICTKYELEWASSSVHADNFLWSVNAYRVSIILL